MENEPIPNQSMIDLSQGQGYGAISPLSHDDLLAAAPSRAALQRYKATLKFIAEAFEFGIHFDVLPQEAWKVKGKSAAAIINDPTVTKFMTKAGAEMLCMAYTLIPKIRLEESIEDFDTPFFKYRAKVSLETASGIPVVEWFGTASSKEPAVAYRWVFREDITAQPLLARTIDLDACRSRSYKAKGEWVTKYQIDNPDLAGEAHNLQQKAIKRALVQATKFRFGLSYLFQTKIGDQVEFYDKVPDPDQPESPEESPQEPAPQRPQRKKSSAGMSDAAAGVKNVFEETCSSLSIAGTKQKQAMDRMFKAAGIKGWGDITSEQAELACQAWIDEVLIPETKQDDLGL
jgi:hypothetical protein